MNHDEDPQDESDEEETEFNNMSAEEQMKGRLNTSIMQPSRMLQSIPMQPFKKQSRNFKIEPKNDVNQSVDMLVATNEEVSIMLPSKMKNIVPTGSRAAQ